jgi:hypothetical protein
MPLALPRARPVVKVVARIRPLWYAKHGLWVMRRLCSGDKLPFEKERRGEEQQLK